MSCGPESRDDTWPHQTIRANLTSNQLWIFLCGRLFYLTNGQAAFHSNSELAVRFDSYHDPGVREYAGLNDQPASHCDGELNPACNKESSKRILEASCRAVEAMRRFASGELFDTPPLKGLTFASDC